MFFSSQVFNTFFIKLFKTQKKTPLAHFPEETWTSQMPHYLVPKRWRGNSPVSQVLQIFLSNSKVPGPNVSTTKGKNKMIVYVSNYAFDIINLLQSQKKMQCAAYELTDLLISKQKEKIVTYLPMQNSQAQTPKIGMQRFNYIQVPTIPWAEQLLRNKTSRIYLKKNRQVSTKLTTCCQTCRRSSYI